MPAYDLKVETCIGMRRKPRRSALTADLVLEALDE